MTTTYGKTTPTEYSDPEIQAVVQNGFALGMVLSKTHMVDVYPFLRYVPFFTSELRRGFEADLDMYTSQLSVARKQLVIDFLHDVT